MVPRVSTAPMARPQPQPHSSNPATAKPTPTKSLLRRPTLAGRVRSREDAGLDIDDDDMSAQPSLSKRARTVTFNPHVQQQTFTSSPEAVIDMEDIRRTVKKALEEHAKSSPDDSRYDNIKEVFSAKNKSKGKSDNDSTRAHLLALSGCVSLLGKSCSGLVKAVLESDWIGREETYVKAYIHFLGHLVSAQGAYVGTVLSMLIGKFATGSKLSYRMDG
jgi:RNA polymerase I-specific transcription initiation factor RRN3